MFSSWPTRAVRWGCVNRRGWLLYLSPCDCIGKMHERSAVSGLAGVFAPPVLSLGTTMPWGFSVSSFLEQEHCWSHQNKIARFFLRTFTHLHLLFWLQVCALTPLFIDFGSGIITWAVWEGSWSFSLSWGGKANVFMNNQQVVLLLHVTTKLSVLSLHRSKSLLELDPPHLRGSRLLLG